MFDGPVPLLLPMATAARHVEGALPSSISGTSTEKLKGWWEEDHGGIRGRYARVKLIIKTYCLLVITNPYLIFARKRACASASCCASTAPSRITCAT